MIEYIQASGIANTIRMVKEVGGSRVALVEEAADLEDLAYVIGDDFFLIPALNHGNLKETVKILHEDNWLFSPLSARKLIYSRFDAAGVAKALGHESTHRFVPHRPTLVVITSSSAPSYWQHLLDEIPGIELLTETQMNTQVPNWYADNARRVTLIRKKFEQGLTVQEQAELVSLRIDLSQRLNAKHPISFEALDELERYLMELKSGADKDESIPLP